jgi:hypothetical protein
MLATKRKPEIERIRNSINASVCSLTGPSPEILLMPNCCAYCSRPKPTGRETVAIKKANTIAAEIKLPVCQTCSGKTAFTGECDTSAGQPRFHISGVHPAFAAEVVVINLDAEKRQIWSVAG